MENRLKITVAICTYNREKYLPILFSSILRQTAPRSAFEVILIDNNSPGNTSEIAAKFAMDHPDIDFHYHLETSQGLSFARNRAIREAGAGYITFLDDDAYIADDYLQKINDFFDRNPDVAAIGSKILLDYESRPPKWTNPYMTSLLGYFNKGDRQTDFHPGEYPRGSNMSFRTSVFGKAGYFNERLGRIGSGLTGSEEKEMFMRIYKFPELRVVYIPDAVVYHAVPDERTTPEFIRGQAIGYGSSERLIAKEKGTGTYVRALIAEAFKWGASFLLFFAYLIRLKPAKGTMLLRFRWWVTKGLITR